MINAILMMFVTGIILGGILALASKVFKVEIDEREKWVTEHLPGYNCGSCGYPGCSGLASALVGKTTDVVSCRPSKPEKRQEIVDYLNSTPGPDGEVLKVKSI